MEKSYDNISTKKCRPLPKGSSNENQAITNVMNC